MTENQLHPFETGPAPAVAVAVAVSRPTPRSLALTYEVTGDVAALKVPSWVSRRRADELWRTTCFEAFIARPGGGYVEINLSPSGLYAVYGFNGYREGMEALAGVEVRDTVAEHDEGRLMLTTILDLDRLSLSEGPWRMGLSTVIETVDGAISYWALAHPSDKPDFHHPDSFVLELP